MSSKAKTFYTMKITRKVTPHSSTLVANRHQYIDGIFVGVLMWRYETQLTSKSYC